MKIEVNATEVVNEVAIAVIPSHPSNYTRAVGWRKFDDFDQAPNPNKN